MTDDDSTPPHHPTFSVHLSDAQIQDIFHTIFNDVEIVSIEQLQRGESFNNRIYFITAVFASAQKRFALKVSGQFFSGRKVENEVGCLALLAYYCPAIPTPKVIAWSLDGTNIESSPEIRGNAGEELLQTQSFVLKEGSEQNRSWVLLECLPGKRLEVDDQNETDQTYVTLMKQLAIYVNEWRTRLPKRQTFGNLRLKRQSHESPSSSLLKVDVSGLILCEKIDEDCNVKAKHDYILCKIEDAVEKLNSSSSFSEQHRQQVQEIIQQGQLSQRLGKLTIFKQPADLTAYFTHYDFSPRNMLVTTDESTGNLIVTGLLDFEFAGYFPIEEEFTNDTIANEGDWPPQLYNAYLDELQRLGCQVPALPPQESRSLAIGDSSHDVPPGESRFPDRQWREAELLAEFIESIAPWRIVAGWYKDQDLIEKLSEAVKGLRAVTWELFGER